ncbi:hypothetical protein [Acinetobacter stercoris]|uniref:FUSC family protein n=1 Tax=Acinetobacter stercoris TaxID=2126983 RepID=A0A2U3N4P8_9GAMM|nr:MULTISPECIES: hypothetical protein [Acinetobacter]SPL72594.1 hypothetical protein KPC_3772 [Acinetobacter stercoris]
MEKIIQPNQEELPYSLHKISHTFDQSKIPFHQLEQELNRQSHIFIVVLGTVIGACISLAIGYATHASLIVFLLLMLLPIAISYLLRKVYIHTLLHFQD